MAGQQQQQELKIPSRWLNCPRRSTLISNKFVVFKAPLDRKYDRIVPEECRFSLEMLFEFVASMKLTMGLIIDLTNTTRFYNGSDVRDVYGCDYKKLKCKGYGEAPTEDLSLRFNAICKEFIQQNPTKIIGLHCTHGYNRSGFLLASYLVRELDWSVEMALDIFREARPPGIYKQDYLDEIFKRFRKSDSTPKAPQLPSWCTELDDVADKDNGDVVLRNANNNKNKTEVLFMDGKVKGVITVSNDEEIVRVQEIVRCMFKMQQRFFPGAHPVSMDQRNIAFLTERPYKVSWKADGVRYLMLIENKDNVFMINRDNTVFKVVQKLTFKKRKELKTDLPNTLLDGEMVLDHVGDRTLPRYLVYDIIKLDGHDVGDWNFELRMMCILKDIIQPRDECKVDRSLEPFSIRAKQFWDLTFSESLLDENFVKTVCHKVDGLIYQPVNMGYKMGQCYEILKWKPASLNSVDFKLSIRTETKEGRLPTMIGDLYVGGQNRPFGVLVSNLTKAIRNLDQKIIECKCI
ncbi:hypothetical protein HELRODRAFT_92373 [Helobdella robusta]|uniref:mRNA-capping enzyme n=1 Tax=Helobdella robusta TaxID=6412 RepID=T1G8F3_HELRO|nr:hypothetical protein HELRODRAFT_92373 [Helobdella robusta]ESO07460.1 hypothetical protein HELRODRAFT_92373 [Helobdella robusta]